VSTGSPIVTTVTQVINVVPPYVWIAMGALAALALALATSSRMTAVRAKRLSRQRHELLADVGLLQAALLPTLPDRVGPVAISGAYRPASGPAAGGDFYDAFALEDGRLALILGDVSGHGRSALPHTAVIRVTLRAYLEAGASPRGALQAAAPTLERQLGDSFATVALATFDPATRILRYACAGHPPPVVGAPGEVVPIIACSAPPIGAGQRTGTRETVVSVPAGVVLFYTDGLVEARVADGLFGPQRLHATLAALEPDATAETLIERIAQATNRHPDDMAACLLHVSGDEGRPRVVAEELELDRREAERGRAERFLRAGGVGEAQIAEVMRTVRESVALAGRIVIELRYADGTPEVVLQPQTVSVLANTLRERTLLAGPTPSGGTL
jgi:hypothetical protein